MQSRELDSCPPDKGLQPLPTLAPLPAIDWTLCALCQTKTCERLQCPADNSRQKEGSSYITVAENIQKFANLGCHFPVPVKPSQLDEGLGIEETFVKQKAKFHRSCRYKVNNTALKRKTASLQNDLPVEVAEEEEDPDCVATAPKQLRRQSTSQAACVCLFCDKKATLSQLRQACTYKLDTNIRESAEKLQDSSLIAKLSTGDVIALEVKYHPDCLVKYYRAAEQTECQDQVDGFSEEEMSHSLAFARLIEYIEETPHHSLSLFLRVFFLENNECVHKCKLLFVFMVIFFTLNELIDFSCHCDYCD